VLPVVAARGAGPWCRSHGWRFTRWKAFVEVGMGLKVGVCASGKTAHRLGAVGRLILLVIRAG